MQPLAFFDEEFYMPLRNPEYSSFLVLRGLVVELGS